MKPVTFLADSRWVVRGFPTSVRQKIGYQLELVQLGIEPDDWKPMATIGAGVREIRVRDASGAFRVIYLAAIEDEVCVLHAFQKKTAKTSKRDIDLARTRLKALQSGVLK